MVIDINELYIVLQPRQSYSIPKDPNVVTSAEEEEAIAKGNSLFFRSFYNLLSNMSNNIFSF